MHTQYLMEGDESVHVLVAPQMSQLPSLTFNIPSLCLLSPVEVLVFSSLIAVI